MVFEAIRQLAKHDIIWGKILAPKPPSEPLLMLLQIPAVSPEQLCK